MLSNRTWYALMAVSLLFTLIGCFKGPLTTDGSYIKFDYRIMDLGGRLGSTRTIRLQSNTQWKISVSKPVPDWLDIEKTTGTGDDSFIITNTRANTNRDYKVAQLMATSTINASLPPAYLTIIQTDSTYTEH